MSVHNRIQFNTSPAYGQLAFHYKLVVSPAMTVALVFSGDYLYETAILNTTERLVRLCAKYPGISQVDHSPSNLHEQMANYLNGVATAFECKIKAFNSGFALAVTKSLAKIPYGKTISYGELANLAGSPHAGRAVGTIMKNNICPIIIPCHRIIKADGTTGNYSAGDGPATKIRLLELEKCRMSF